MEDTDRDGEEMKEEEEEEADDDGEDSGEEEIVVMSTATPAEERRATEYLAIREATQCCRSSVQGREFVMIPLRERERNRQSENKSRRSKA